MLSDMVKVHWRRLLYMTCRYISGNCVICLTGVRHINVPNLRTYKGVLLVANHQSFFDPVMIGMPLERPINYLARSTLFDNPIFGSLIRALGTIPLRRDSADGAALRAALSVLRSGRPLLLFPEGTRTDDGNLGEMGSGPALMASRCNVPVIPICVEGAYKAWPRDRMVPRPARAVVVYGDPIQPSEHRSGAELNDMIVESILNLREHARAFLDKSDYDEIEIATDRKYRHDQ